MIAISFLMILYLCIRGLVSVVERLFAPAALRRMKRTLSEATSYSQWREAAESLDDITGRNFWKSQSQSRYYAYKLVSNATAELRSAIDSEDYYHLLRCLQHILRDVNFAGHLDEDLYSKTYAGTKWDIDDFCDTVCEGLRVLRKQVETNALPAELAEDSVSETDDDGRLGEELSANGHRRHHATLSDVLKFTEFSVCTFGRTALCLSGGAAMALQHFGVVLELFQRGLLPKVISGTSGGAVVSCYVCCRSDAELRGEVEEGEFPLRLDPEHIRTRVPWPFHGTLASRAGHYLRHGCIFSAEVWEECSRPWALGDTTFLEAYLRSGRVLNITTHMKAADGGQQSPVLLNYQTHPHVLVRSAFLCSAAMPGLAHARKLLEKCPKTGEIRAHSEEMFYADGSVDYDIPVHTLAQTFGVRYTIASQVNPHVTPFLFAHHGEAGKPVHIRGGRGRWRGGFLLSAGEVVVKEVLRSILKLLAVLEFLPKAFGTNWALLFTQNFEGSVTLSTTSGYLWKLAHVIENPSKEDLEYWCREGQQMLWRKMALIEKRLLPEAELFRLEAAVDAAVHGGRRSRLTPTTLTLPRRRTSLH